MRPPINVLFIEDNSGDARLVKEELIQAGKASDIHLDWVDRLDKGIERLKLNGVHAVLLDLNLPDSTGLDTLKQVLAVKAGTVVIVMTGQADENLAIRTVQAGAQDYLVKGQVDGGLLSRAIHYAIERRQAEEKLQESEDKFRYVFDESIIGKAITQTTGEMHVNRAFAEILGYSIDEMKNRNYLEITHPEDVGTSRGMMDLLMSGEANSARFTKRYIHRDGRVVWAEESLHLRWDREGKPLYFISAINDITDRLQMESALRESERFIHSTMNALSSDVAVLDETGTIIYVNRAWSDFANDNDGDPKRTGVGMNYLSVCDEATPPNDEFACEMAAGIRSVMNGEQSVFTIEYSCHSPDEQRWFMALVTRFEESGPLRIVIQHENISGRRQTEDELRRSEERFSNAFEFAPSAWHWLLLKEKCKRSTAGCAKCSVIRQRNCSPKPIRKSRTLTIWRLILPM